MIDAITKYLVGDAANELEGLRFFFNVPFAQALAWALLLAIAIAVILFFWNKMTLLPPPSRSLLIALRAAAVLLILFLLLDPCLSGKRILSSDRAVLLLFDDSKSMTIDDLGAQTRAQRLQETYEAAREEFEKAMADKCQLIFYRFGESTERIGSPQELSFQQNQSDLTGAIEAALADFQGEKVAAVALISDGVYQTQDRAANPNDLPQTTTPIYTIGVGTDSTWRDLEVGPLSVKRIDFDESPVILKVPLRATGLSGHEAIVEATLNGTTIEETRLSIDAQTTDLEARLEFIPPEQGWLEIQVSARLASETVDPNASPLDRVPQNNARTLLLDNRDKTYRILYLCGRPNWENKFIRMALQEDRQLKLTSLVRISGAEKTFKYRGQRSNLANPIFEGTDVTQDTPRYDEALFLRFGVEKSELDRGYPDHPAELFPYHLVIWGEMEAEFFSKAQLETTRDFVRKRGGALLLLGGRHSFTEGGFDGTIIESLLPARLAASGSSQVLHGLDSDQAFQPLPTLEGLLSGAWSLDPNPQQNQILWEDMPPLYRINQFAMTRPGATIHATASAGNSPSSDDALPLFAIQRYGEGLTAMLATGSTWQWRMSAKPKDRSHERLWRQIVRSLVRQSIEPIQLRQSQETYRTGQTAHFDFLVRDELYDEREGLGIRIIATSPSGQELPLPAEESIQEPGVYSTDYTPQEPGMHKLSLSALDDQGKTVGITQHALLAQDDRSEFQHAQANPDYLRALAQSGGGRYLPIEKLAQLPDLIKWQPSEKAQEARIHLWRFPGFYALLATLLIAEWYLRRRRGYC